MILHPGDLVRTPDGLLGKVVQIDRATAFVVSPTKQEYGLKAYLINELVLVPSEPEELQTLSPSGHCLTNVLPETIFRH